MLTLHSLSVSVLSLFSFYTTEIEILWDLITWLKSSRKSKIQTSARTRTPNHCALLPFFRLLDVKYQLSQTRRYNQKTETKKSQYGILRPWLWFLNTYRKATVPQLLHRHVDWWRSEWCFLVSATLQNFRTALPPVQSRILVPVWEVHYLHREVGQRVWASLNTPCKAQNNYFYSSLNGTIYKKCWNNVSEGMKTAYNLS